MPTPKRRFATLCVLMAALASAAQAFDVLTITNASKQTWSLNPSHCGAAPVAVTLGGADPEIYKGGIITLGPAKTAVFTYLPWGAVMPRKYRDLEAAPGHFARHNTFDVIDSKGVGCSLVDLYVDSKQEKANISLAENWVKTWTVPGQLQVKATDVGPELVIVSDFAHIKAQ